MIGAILSIAHDIFTSWLDGKGEENEKRGEAYIELASGLESLERNQLDSIHPLRKAFSIFAQHRDYKGVALATEGLAKYYAGTRRFDVARNQYNAAVAALKRAGELIDDDDKECEELTYIKINVLRELGDMELACGDREEASRQYDEAIRIVDYLDMGFQKYLSKAVISYSIGCLEAHKENYQEAEAKYNLALESLDLAQGELARYAARFEKPQADEIRHNVLQTKAKINKSLADAMGYLAARYEGTDKENYERKQSQLYHDAQKIFIRLNDVKNEAHVIVAMADMTSSPKNPTAVRSNLHKALAMFESIGDRQGIALAKWKIGELYTNCFNLSEIDLFWQAEAVLLESLALSKNINDKMSEMCALLNLGDLWKKAGTEIFSNYSGNSQHAHSFCLRSDHKREYLETALQIYRETQVLVDLTDDFTGNTFLRWRFAQIHKCLAEMPDASETEFQENTKKAIHCFTYLLEQYDHPHYSFLPDAIKEKEKAKLKKEISSIHALKWNKK